jgi:hypothetical protein
MHILEQLIAGVWNRSVGRHRPEHSSAAGTTLGTLVVDGRVTNETFRIGDRARTEHLACLGRTGKGKSRFLRHIARQDVQARRGFCYFDLHGDATPDFASHLAAEETRTGEDLSTRTIIIEPGDREYSVGLNIFEQRDSQQSFVQIAEFAQVLKQRWHLDSFGARTEELLRNSLYVLSDCQLTLLELAPLLTNYAFRAACLRQVRNSDVREYFSTRFDRASEGMQAMYRDAILNKVSTFTADPHFRHILGQRRSSFSLLDALDQGYWVLLNLDKGRLGEQATTLGSLFLTRLKNALFSRRSRRLFTLFCDEIQNLVSFDSGLDTLFSEARKFGISVISANQFLDQYPAQMRSAILAVGTHVFFQLSSGDADKLAAALDGGKSLTGLLKNLPDRHMVIKSGHHRWVEAKVPRVDSPRASGDEFYRRCRERWARRRSEIEAEIISRHAAMPRSSNEVLNEWE